MAGDVPRATMAGQCCPPCAHGRAGMPMAGLWVVVSMAAGMGMLGPGKGREASSPGGTVCLVPPPAACQL